MGARAKGVLAVAAVMAWATPACGMFETWVNDDELGVGGPGPEGVGLELRVAKAIGDRGYNVVRVSAITVGPREFDDFEFDYSAPFQHRWTHAYDVGRPATACDAASRLELRKVEHDGECLVRCNAEPRCAFYTYFAKGSLCALSTAACQLSANASAQSTYHNFGQRCLHSALVTMKPGRNDFTIGSVPVTVTLPAEDEGTSGIIWSDPCYASRWVGCLYSRIWNSFNESHRMLNAIAEDPSVHFFQVLGDNWYDQDGRLTKALFDRFSLAAKQKFLQTAVGNHDIWVAGGPPGDSPYDQYGHGFMQYYTHDTMAAMGDGPGLFDFSVNPDLAARNDVGSFRNDPANFFWYHKLGNLGFVGYAGASDLKTTLGHLRQACAYFDRSKPAYIFLLGHWNEPGDGCDKGMETPAIRKAMLEMDGCDLGSRLKYIDGHEHCNTVQERDASGESIGFETGGHGMWDSKCLPVSGFTFVDSSRDGKLRVFHFVEHTLFTSSYQDILDCIKERGSIKACTHLASLWFEGDLAGDTVRTVAQE